MKPTIVRRRGRALASLTATVGMCFGAATVVSSPAQSAEPAGDCATAFPVADLVKGDAVTGLTVTGVASSTEPEAFTGEVLGVIQDGIAPDLDMVMVRLSSPEIDRVGGIWQGMSGSPVYGPGGDLIGAVAYGLSWGPTPVAGVTPFGDMQTYLKAAPAGKVAVGDRAARIIASNTEVTESQAEQGFSQLPMPTGVSGISGHRLSQTLKQRADHKWLPKSAYTMGSAAAAGAPAAGPETIEAGGNLAASLSYGDVTMAGVGTATSVCDGKVVGFGHPLSFLGRTTLTMHPADALYIQEESLGAPFKVANLGAPAGTITEDHLTGITGVFGSLPQTTGITSSVSYLDRARTGSSHVSVPEAAAATTFYELVANHDRVLDSIVVGSSLLTWTITGHDEDGAPFSLVVPDRYASDWDITIESAWEVADFVYALSAIQGVVIDDVTMDSSVNDDNSTWRVGKVEQRRGGEWVKVNRHHKAVAKAGDDLKLRATLTSGTDTRTVPLTVAIPKKVAERRAQMYVLGGSYYWSENSWPRSLAQAKRFAKNHVRNDEVVASFSAFTRRARVERTVVSDAQDKVVEGYKRVRVILK